jgi:hypothetical protein
LTFPYNWHEAIVQFGQGEILMIWLGEIVQTVEVFGGKASYCGINAYIRTPKAALSGLKSDNYELHAIQKGGLYG